MTDEKRATEIAIDLWNMHYNYPTAVFLVSTQARRNEALKGWDVLLHFPEGCCTCPVPDALVANPNWKRDYLLKQLQRDPTPVWLRCYLRDNPLDALLTP